MIFNQIRTDELLRVIRSLPDANALASPKVIERSVMIYPLFGEDIMTMADHQEVVQTIRVRFTREVYARRDGYGTGKWYEWTMEVKEP